MAAHEGSVPPDPNLEKAANLDFQGFESENSSEHEDGISADAKLSEFIRNLPGLPSSNPLLNTNANEIVSCDAASGPLEDNTEVTPKVLEKQCNSSTADIQSHQDVKVSTGEIGEKEKNGSEHKSRDKHSRHRSSRECRRCYERRKVKKCNVGVQCKVDKHLSKNGAHHSSLPRAVNTSSSMPHWEHHKFASLIRMETYPNGGASVLRMYQEEIDRLNLNEKEMKELADEFIKVT